MSTYKSEGGGQRPVHKYAHRSTKRLKTRAARKRAALRQEAVM